MVLLAFANDREGQFLRSISEEHKAVEAALTPLQDKGLLQVEELPNATAEDIFEHFRRFKDRIISFHYGGHAQDLELLLSGSQTPLDVTAFAEYLSYQKGLKLVFMNGCSTAAQQEPLENTGIPHLILTDSAINDSAAQAFATTFYHNLASGRDVGRAFAEAEASVKAQSIGETRSLDWEALETAGEVLDMPWRLIQQGELRWTLRTKAPYPYRKLAAYLTVITFLLVSGFGVWKFLIPFELTIPVELPKGVNATHFNRQHSLDLFLADQVIHADILPDGFVKFPRISGKDSKAALKLNSPYWKTSDSIIKLHRTPRKLSLEWAHSLSQIRGRIRDERGPISHVQITLFSNEVQSMSNKNGQFSLNIPENNIPDIQHKLILRKAGYTTIRPTVNLGDEQSFYEFYLEKSKP